MSSQDNLTANPGLETCHEQVENVDVKQEATRMSMTAVQASFPRLNICWFMKGTENGITFLSVLLFNLWSRLVSINQITNACITSLYHNANDEFVSREWYKIVTISKTHHAKYFLIKHYYSTFLSLLPSKLSFILLSVNSPSCIVSIICSTRN